MPRASTNTSLSSVFPDDGSSLFVVLTDGPISEESGSPAHSSSPSSTPFRKGDLVRIVQQRRGGEWSEVELVGPRGAPAPAAVAASRNGGVGGAGGSARGWLRSHALAPIGASLERQPWYHGAISRIEAESLLSSGINGSYLIRCAHPPSPCSILFGPDSRRVAALAISRPNRSS